MVSGREGDSIILVAQNGFRPHIINPFLTVIHLEVVVPSVRNTVIDSAPSPLYYTLLSHSVISRPRIRGGWIADFRPILAPSAPL